ncbi:hypothetical protein [Paludibacterium yongneupense]|uniref:hypothetical protein n=1 Tax=Paludibacterium yongneupense TaxID=400061 RepID=UPI0012EB6E36|nr:hypothetical protein [Paludibacterium yongneupense]
MPLALLLAAACLLPLGVMAGLARLGVAMPAAITLQAGWHGVLMIPVFFTALIGLERAKAWGRWPGLLAPLAALTGGGALLSGAPLAVVQWLLALAALWLAVVSAILARRQLALFTVLLVVAALCDAVGTLTWIRAGTAAALPGWLAFLVLTIAAERLELSRLLTPPPRARRAMVGLVSVMVAALSVTPFALEAGLRLFALALLGVALWLVRYDVARRTIRLPGLPRYIALCLLGGYGWLAACAIAALGGALVPGDPWRDATIHMLTLGFIMAMVFGHAPVIVPALTGLRVRFHAAWYLPLLALFCSLLLRVAAVDDFGRRVLAAELNGAALALFIFVLLCSLTRRARHHPE